MSIELDATEVAAAFPSGDSRPIAVLAGEPAVLARRYRLSLHEAEDDLDRFHYVEVNLGCGLQAWLMRHRGDPNPGTVVRVDAAVSPVAARRLLVDSLSLEDRDVIWWAPDTIEQGAPVGLNDHANGVLEQHVWVYNETEFAISGYQFLDASCLIVLAMRKNGQKHWRSICERANCENLGERMSLMRNDPLAAMARALL